MGTQNRMMFGWCGGKTRRDTSSNHSLDLAVLCPRPGPHPAPSFKHLRSPSLPHRCGKTNVQS